MNARLAAEVRSRRSELALNLIQVRDRGGPPPPIMVRVERGDTSVLTDDTLTALDHALEWTVGSAASVRAGATPIPRESAEIQFVTSGVTITHAELAALTAAALRLQKLGHERSSDRELAIALVALDEAVAPLYGQFVTELLAANTHGLGSQAVVDVIAPLLAGPANERDEGAALRRWLSGIEADEARKGEA